MKRYLLWGGGILAGLWFIKRAVYPTVAGLLSGPDLGSYNTDTTRLFNAVANQIRKSKHELTSYTSAEDLSLFWKTPATDTQAFLKGAYWMAVASRLLGGNDALIRKSQTYYGKAKKNFAIPGDNYFLTSNVSSIMRGAADALRPYGGNKQVAAVLVAAFQQSDPGKIDTAQQGEAARDPYRQVAETVTRSADDAASAANDAVIWVRDGLGLKRPDGQEPPWWRKWLVRGGVAVAGLVALRVFFAPQYHAVKSTVSSTIGRVRAVAGPAPTPTPPA